MARRDIYNDKAFHQSIAPQTATTTVDGAGVDTQGAEGMLAILDLGTFGGTTPVCVPHLQESDDDVTYTDVAVADLLGGALPAQINSTNDAQVHARGYIGNKRYLRWRLDGFAGTSPSLPVSGLIIRGALRHAPVGTKVV